MENEIGVTYTVNYECLNFYLVPSHWRINILK